MLWKVLHVCENYPSGEKQKRKKEKGMCYERGDWVELWPANEVAGLHKNGLKLHLHFPEDVRIHIF